MKLAYALLLLAVACGGGTKAGSGSTTPAGGGGEPAAPRPMPIPDELKPAVEQAKRVGLLLYRLDRATGRASDAVLARGTPPPEIRGWIAMPISDTEVGVAFLGEVGGEVKTFFQVRVNDDGVTPPAVTAYAPAERVPEPYASAWSARQVAAAKGPELLAAAGATLCAGTHNTVVIPSQFRDGSDGTLVYLLAATTDPQVQILAGHQRIHVGPGGAATAELMSHGCLMARPDAGADFKVQGAWVTHDLTPVPLESHVFASLNHGIPIYVATSRDRAWLVSGTDIVLLAVDPTAAPPGGGGATPSASPR